MNAFTQWAKRWDTCIKCGLSESRRQPVHGRGTLPCNFLFIGLGPGKSEDMLGEAFVGRSGRLVDDFYLPRVPVDARWYLTNVVACRPCDGFNEPNRDPTPGEAETCRGRLQELLGLLGGTVVGVVLLGRVAEVWGASLARQAGLPVWPMKHPAYWLRMGGSTAFGFDCEIRKMARWMGRIWH